jgi:hypothetical protein
MKPNPAKMAANSHDIGFVRVWRKYPAAARERIKVVVLNEFMAFKA